MRHKLGLVLSGGGAKGAAHIGVLKAMAEHNVEATCIAGTSAGAVVGAFYASGLEAEEILGIFKNSSLFSPSKIAFGKPGIMDLDKFLGYFEQHLKVQNFEQLKKEVYIIATDLIEGKMEIINSGSLVSAMLASSAFPLILSPFKSETTVYADGGITNNFPVEPLIEKCEYILGSYVSPLKKITADSLSNSWDVVDRAYRISNRFTSIQKFDKCTWVIRPEELEQYGTFEMNKIDKIFEIGYRHALQIIPAVVQRMKFH